MKEQDFFPSVVSSLVTNILSVRSTVFSFVSMFMSLISRVLADEDGSLRVGSDTVDTDGICSKVRYVEY